METIKCGWPEKEFSPTGEWVEFEQGITRARRNRTKIYVPEYQADDGEKIYPMWLQSKNPPNKVFVADRA